MQGNLCASLWGRILPAWSFSLGLKNVTPLDYLWSPLPPLSLLLTFPSLLLPQFWKSRRGISAAVIEKQAEATTTWMVLPCWRTTTTSSICKCGGGGLGYVGIITEGYNWNMFQNRCSRHCRPTHAFCMYPVRWLSLSYRRVYKLSERQIDAGVQERKLYTPAMVAMPAMLGLVCHWLELLDKFSRGQQSLANEWPEFYSQLWESGQGTGSLLSIRRLPIQLKRRETESHELRREELSMTALITGLEKLGQRKVGEKAHRII